MNQNGPNIVSKGGMGIIKQDLSAYRFEKERFERFSEPCAQLFKDFIEFDFPILAMAMERYNDGHFFNIPANLFTTQELQDILNELDSLGLMNMGAYDLQVRLKISENPFFETRIKELAAQLNLEVEAIANQLIQLFSHLKEFIIVEYLNSLDSQFAEHIVHNHAFTIDKVGNFYSANLQLENWSGTENESPTTNTDYEDYVVGEEFFAEAEFGSVDNLNSLISRLQFDVTDSKEIEKRQKLVRAILISMLPMAKTIDFINSTSINKLVSKEGESVLESQPKEAIEHLDLKPENFFGRILKSTINGKKYFKLVLGDFGVAAFQKRKNQGQGIGSPGYVAPEIVTREITSNIDKADIYSFTVTLFEALTGRIPDVIIRPANPGEANVAQADRYHLNEYIETFAKKFLVHDTNTNHIVEAYTNLNITEEDKQRLIQNGVATEENIDSVVAIFAHGMSIFPHHRYSSCSELMDDLVSQIRQVNSMPNL